MQKLGHRELGLAAGVDRFDSKNQIFGLTLGIFARGVSTGLRHIPRVLIRGNAGMGGHNLQRKALRVITMNLTLDGKAVHVPFHTFILRRYTIAGREIGFYPDALAARVAELEAALKPFAETWDCWPDNDHLRLGDMLTNATVGDARRAAALLAKGE